MMKLVGKEFKDIKDEKYLRVFYNVMSKIGEQYGPIVTKEGKSPFKKEICERNYIIYISFILGCMYGNKLLESKDYINGEIYKHLNSFSDKSKDAYEKFLKFKNSRKKKEGGQNEQLFDDLNVRPDFVIHDSHSEDYETIGQKLIVEAKSSLYLDDVDFCWDLMKLNFYLEKLKFHNCIYMIVNTTKTEIQKMIDLYTTNINYYSNDLPNLWFFVQNQDKDQMLPVELYQLSKVEDDKDSTKKTETIYTE